MTGPLPRDTALPQLATAFDAEAMAAVFDRALSSHDATRVLTCRVDRIKYRPHRNCSVSYVLRLQRGPRERPYDQRVAARFCSAGDSARRYTNALRQPHVSSAAGPALVHVPALDMLAHWLPNDARLDVVALLHDDAALRTRCLPELARALGGQDAQPASHRLELVQYVPEHRVCARMTFHLRRGPGAPVSACTLYAKGDVEARGGHTHSVLQWLQRSSAQRSARLRIPRPVLWQPATGLQWQLAVSGQALRSVDPQVGLAMSERLGRELAVLHATPVPLPLAASVDELRQHARDVAELLASVEPAWLPRLAPLVRLLAAGGEALRRQKPVTLHGDLHPRNILVEGSRFAFIDLDDALHGPAVLELGAWIGGALYRGALDGVAPPTTMTSCRAFLGAYTMQGGHVADEPLLAWSVAHDLLCRRAYRCVANLKPGRYGLVPRLLELAHAIASAGTIEAGLQRPAEAA